MRESASVWGAIGLCTVLFGYVLAFGSSGGNLVFLFLAILGTALFHGVGYAMRKPVDASWLVRWVTLGFVVKALGSWARHWMVTIFYAGGDAYRYYDAGVALAQEWRSGSVPGLTGSGSQGTQVIESITGGMFAIFTPDMLSGFLMFSILAYLGQLMIYSGFRHWAAPHQLKFFAILIFLFPTYSFWPSSIGKDSVVLFLLGGSVYFTARVLQAFELRFVIGLVAFLTPLGFVRIHIAGLVVAGLVGAGLLAKLRPDARTGARFRRFVFLGVAVAGGAIVVATVPGVLGVDLTGEDSIDAFTKDVVRRTTESGTIAEGGPVGGFADIPEAVALVLFRPAIFEAREIQHLFAAVETTAVAGLTIWLLPSVLRNRRRWRENGFVVFCSVYVLSYSVAFSIVRQLGIVARQRGQVLAMFLAILVILGLEQKEPQRFVHPAFRVDEVEESPSLERVTGRVSSGHLASHAASSPGESRPTSSF